MFFVALQVEKEQHFVGVMQLDTLDGAVHAADSRALLRVAIKEGELLAMVETLSKDNHPRWLVHYPKRAASSTAAPWSLLMMRARGAKQNEHYRNVISH